VKLLLSQEILRLPFMETEGSLTCSHDPVTDRCPEPDECSPHTLLS